MASDFCHEAKCWISNIDVKVGKKQLIEMTLLLEVTIQALLLKKLTCGALSLQTSHRPVSGGGVSPGATEEGTRLEEEEEEEATEGGGAKEKESVPLGRGRGKGRGGGAEGAGARWAVRSRENGNYW